MNISFVILHYLTYEDTINCVESIFNNLTYPDISIVIVDNGSPNGTGQKVFDKYANDSRVHVILSKENLGFAKGNNIGFKYAKYELKADFIVMINNDIIIEQKDFCERLIKDYEKEKFHVCGPNIISLVDNKPQNPIPKIFYNSKQVKKMKFKFTLLNILSYIRCDLLLESMINSKSKGSSGKKELKEYQIHGSGMIFSKDFIDKYDGLCEDTFMYMEECILKFICDRDNLKMIYCGDLLIYHKEDSATNALVNKGYKKRRFFYKNSIDSCNVLIKMMMEYERNKINVK